ncbi:hypothetical protein RUND412_004033 [Rhizina undulata]
MPPSIPAPSHPPPNAPLPELPPSGRPATPSKSDQQKAMSSKSASITARSNYVSPYRQTPPVRSVSSPVNRPKTASSVGKTQSPNFKDIVTRFNSKHDEKIPNPSNRIPAVAAGPGTARTRKAPTPKLASSRDNENGHFASSSRSGSGTIPSTGSGKAGQRSASAMDSFGGSLIGPANNRTRSPSSSMSCSSDSVKDPRFLPPLDTFVKQGHQRSHSAMETHSPSAASLADNEGEKRTLGHRRSRSNIEISTSPIDPIRIDPYFAKRSDGKDHVVSRSTRSSPRSPQPGKSAIPIPTRLTSKSSPSSPTSRNALGSSRNVGNRLVASKHSLAPISVSPHGSRHHPQPSKSPTLTAYITAPLPKKSPPLRSSRGQRLSPAATTLTRYRSQNGGSAPHSPSGRYRRKHNASGENKGKDIKKKIPELGSIDFAARRAQIQSAFNKNYKSNEGKDMHPGVSKKRLKVDFENCESEAQDTAKPIFQERIDEEDEEQFEEKTQEAELEREAKMNFTYNLDGVNEEEPKEKLEIADHMDVPSISYSEDTTEPDNQSPVPNTLNPQTSPVEKRISRYFPDGITFFPDKDKRSSRHLSPVEADYPVSPTTKLRRLSFNEVDVRNRPISVIITPDSPLLLPSLAQVSQFLRPDSTTSDWSTDSDRSPHMRNGMLHPETGNDVAVGYSKTRTYDQLNANTHSAVDSIATPIEYLKAETLSPMSKTNDLIDTPNSDRATIVDVFDHYDEPREDFLKSYAATEVDTEPETDLGMITHDEYAVGEERETDEDEHQYDEQYNENDEYTSCSEAVDSARPSLESHSGEEWSSSSSQEGPQIEFHPARPSIEIPHLPDIPRQIIEESESPVPPTPPPKDYHFLPPAPPAKDPPRPLSPASSLMKDTPPLPAPYRTHSNGSPQLPEIERDTEPLGLAIQVIPMAGQSTPTTQPPTRPGIERQYSYPRIESYGQARISVDTQYGRQSLDQYSSQRPSLENGRSFTSKPYSSPSSYYSEGESRRSSAFTGPNGQRYSETPASSMAPTARGSGSIYSQENPPEQQPPNVTPEQKLLTRRRNLLKELVDTEYSFHRDMTVAVEIYKGSANACISITPDDVKVLFGNTDLVTQFSKTFLEILKDAVRSVYVMQRGRSAVDSSAVSLANSMNSGDEQSLKMEFPTEEEKDRKTYIGEAFNEVLVRMEKIYGDYCKNHDAAVQRLQKLEGDARVSVWLRECKVCAEDLTNAWNLESLLIKPVQRVLKYPLLLTQLLECTPHNHPDYPSLQVAAKEMKFAADRINEMKKRKDMVEKIVGRKRTESDIRHGISKSFARRAEKLRQSVGLSEVVVDEQYNKLFEIYNMHFVQVQVVIRDIEIYIQDIQMNVEKFLEFTLAIKDFIDVAHSQHPEVEGKWRQFDTSMREMANTYLQEHRLRVRKHAVEPLETLLKMHESPQKIMTKRNKKAVDYARFKAIKDRGDIPDKKTTDMADAYVALNETLIDELPKLFRLTKKLVDAVLANFVELQAQWMNSWSKKIKMTFINLEMSQRLEEVIDAFMGDFSFNEQSLNHLNICNGALNNMQFPGDKPQLQNASSTLTLDAFDSSSYLRPRTSATTAADGYGREPPSPGRDRAFSLTGSHSPTMSTFSFTTRSERRHSGGSSISPLIAVAPALPALPQLATATPSQFTRVRAGSAALPQKTPVTPVLNNHVHRSFSTSTGDPRKLSSRDSSSSRFDPHSLSSSERPESRSAYSSSINLTEPRVENSRATSPSPLTTSGAFSSAMPMEDDRDIQISNPPTRTGSRASSSHGPGPGPGHGPGVANNGKSVLEMGPGNNSALFVAASLYEFNIDKQRREGGFPYLTYVQGEIFDVIGIKGEVWLARNQDDGNGEIGWIWCRHFQRLPEN